MPTKSKYAEMADAEAAKLEADAPDDDDDETETETEPDDDEAEAEGEAETEAETEPAELSADEVQRRLERAHNTYAAALELALGEAWGDMHDCPLCNALGYVASTGPVLKPDVELCPDCNGHGQQLTPSLVPEHISETCMTCSGNGWRTRVTPIEPTPNFVTGTNGAATPAPVVPPMPIYDPQTNTWRDQFGNALAAAAG